MPSMFDADWNKGKYRQELHSGNYQSLGSNIYAYSVLLGQGNSNMDEAVPVLLFRIKWCVNNGINLVSGEKDSILIAKCAKKEWKPPWRIKRYRGNSEAG